MDRAFMFHLGSFKQSYYILSDFNEDLKRIAIKVLLSGMDIDFLFVFNHVDTV